MFLSKVIPNSRVEDGETVQFMLLNTDFARIIGCGNGGNFRTLTSRYSPWSWRLGLLELVEENDGTAFRLGVPGRLIHDPDSQRSPALELDFEGSESMNKELSRSSLTIPLSPSELLLPLLPALFV